MPLYRNKRFGLGDYDEAFLYRANQNFKKTSRREAINPPTIVQDGLVLAYDFGDKYSLNGISAGNSVIAHDLVKVFPARTPDVRSIPAERMPLVLMNGTAYTNNKGGGLSFDGVNDGLWNNSGGALANHFGITGNLPSTMNCWVRFNAISTDGQIFMFWGNGNTNQMRAYYHKSSRLAVAYYNNDVVSTFTPVVNRIYMVTWTENGAGSINLYVDGIFRQTLTAASAPATSTGGILIGNGLITATYNFNGTLFAFNIYNRVLSRNEVAQNYNATKYRYI